MTKSNLERAFLTRWRQLVPDPALAPVQQHRWAAAEVGLGRGIRKRLKAAGLRDWRLDFAWPSRKVAVELQGGTWTRGRHTRGAGYRKDCERLNALQAHGWRVFYMTGGMLRDDAVGIVEMIREALREEL